MRIKKNGATTRRGSALLIALLALAGLSILGLSLMLVSDTEMQISNDARLRNQALYAAEAGIEHALVYLQGIDPQYLGYNAGNPGLLSGNAGFNAPTQPPDDLMSYNDPIVKTENLYNFATPWQAPALARKGNILYFDKDWFKSGATQPTTPNYAIRDVPFEKSAGGSGMFDVGAFKARYTVYVRNNLDDPAAVFDGTNPLENDPKQYENDQDETLVLTGEGIVDVGTQGSPTGTGYKVVRTVRVSVRSAIQMTFDSHSSAGGGDAEGNRTSNDTVQTIDPVPTSQGVDLNQDWN